MAAVENAAGYVVRVDGEEYTVLKDAAFDLNKVKIYAGVHKVCL